MQDADAGAITWRGCNGLKKCRALDAVVAKGGSRDRSAARASATERTDNEPVLTMPHSCGHQRPTTTAGLRARRPVGAAVRRAAFADGARASWDGKGGGSNASLGAPDPSDVCSLNRFRRKPMS